MLKHRVFLVKQFNESEIKYLAGLMDADGWISFSFVKNRVYLSVAICQSVVYDKNGYLDSLGQRAGRTTVRKTTHRDVKTWHVRDERDLNILVPRLVKHMVIKGKHLQRMFDKYKSLRGTVCTDEELEELKTFSIESRKDAGPLKAKTHPTWAWVAGYLDGDGHYNFSKKRETARIEVCAHESDIVSLEFLQKAFGGTIKKMTGKDAGSNFRWFKNLGKRDKKFAQSFLKKVHKHSRFKKWKIEQILAFHNQAATTECSSS